MQLFATAVATRGMLLADTLNCGKPDAVVLIAESPLLPRLQRKIQSVSEKGHKSCVVVNNCNITL